MFEGRLPEGFAGGLSVAFHFQRNWCMRNHRRYRRARTPERSVRHRYQHTHTCPYSIPFFAMNSLLNVSHLLFAAVLSYCSLMGSGTFVSVVPVMASPRSCSLIVARKVCSKMLYCTVVLLELPLGNTREGDPLLVSFSSTVNRAFLAVDGRSITAPRRLVTYWGEICLSQGLQQ